VPAAVRSTGVGNSGAGTATSFSPTMPAGFVAGDLLIGIACNGTGEIPATRPSGSTLIQNMADSAVFGMDVVRKVAVGGDVFTWTTTSTLKWAGCVIAVTAGTYNTTTPVQGNVGAAQGATAALIFTTPASTPGNADSLAIAAFGRQVAATWSTTDGSPAMTEICDTTSTGTSATSLGVYRSNTAPAVSSLTRSASGSVSSANGCMFLVFVNPAPVVFPSRRNINMNRRAVQRASRW
jgi:hypothetical protein